MDYLEIQDTLFSSIAESFPVRALFQNQLSAASGDFKEVQSILTVLPNNAEF